MHGLLTFGGAPLNVPVVCRECVWICDPEHCVVPERSFGLTNAPEAHLVIAKLWGETGNAMSHSVQITKDGLMVNTLQNIIDALWSPNRMGSMGTAWVQHGCGMGMLTE